jgi:hypothetical protein
MKKLLSATLKADDDFSILNFVSSLFTVREEPGEGRALQLVL